MNKAKLVHNFKTTVFASRQCDGDENFPQYFDTEDDALSEDGVFLEGEDEQVGLVAEYKLVRVRKVKFDSRIVEVK